MGIIRDPDKVSSTSIVIPSEKDGGNLNNANPVHLKFRTKVIAISVALGLSGLAIFGGIKYSNHRKAERLEQISNSPAIKNLKEMFPGFRDLKLIDSIGFGVEQEVQGIEFQADVVDSNGEVYRTSNGDKRSKTCRTGIEADDKTPEMIFPPLPQPGDPMIIDNFSIEYWAQCMTNTATR